MGAGAWGGTRVTVRYICIVDLHAYIELHFMASQTTLEREKMESSCSLTNPHMRIEIDRHMRHEADDLVKFMSKEYIRNC